MAAEPGALPGAGAPSVGRSAADVRAAAGRSDRGRWWREVGWRHVVGVAAVVFALFPVVWVFSASINSTGTLAGQRLFPANPTLDNYRSVLGQTSFLRWFGNSMIVAGVTSVAAVFLSALAAYAFSRMRFRGRRAGLLALLLVQMFPQLLAVVAIFLLMVRIAGITPAIGLGTKEGLILVYLGGALGVNTWLMKGFFDTIPSELDESARVDGATHAQIYFRIILPLVAPILAVIGLLAFIAAINEFIIAQAVVGGSEENWTMAIGLFRFINERYGSRWGPFSAGALIGSIPTVLLFLFLQRFIVSGLTQGSVKG